MFQPDVQHGKANALSRRPDFALRLGDNAYSQQSHCFLRPYQLQMFTTSMLHDDSLLNEIAKATISDLFTNKIIAHLNAPSPDAKISDLNQFTTRDGLLYRNHLLYVPNRSCRTRYYKPVLMILFLVTLGSQKHWSCYLEDFGIPIRRSFSRNLSTRVTYVLAPKRLTIGHTVFFTHSQFQVDHGLAYPWTL